MLNTFKNALREKSPLFSRAYEKYLVWRRGSDFEPYLCDFSPAGLHFQFFIGTTLARDWYDPVKPHALAEYEWVVRNIPLEGAVIADCGCHHGHYAVVFGAMAGEKGFLHVIDPSPSNMALTRVNLALNGLSAKVGEFAVAEREGFAQFSVASNGRIVAGGGVRVACRTLESLDPTPTVVKLDIEGAEYDVLPGALKRMGGVNAWIIEIHPLNRSHPDGLVDLLIASGYSISFVDRDSATVRPYERGLPWPTHSTVFALKP